MKESCFWHGGSFLSQAGAAVRGNGNVPPKNGHKKGAMFH
jgi:hypothetical protein